MSSSPVRSIGELPDEVEVLVVGAGLMGAMTAMAASARGVGVVVVEQYETSHLHGSSHGSARIVRRAYPDGFYVGMTGRAFELWNELERRSGTELLRMSGGLDHGAVRDVTGLARQLGEAGVEHELIDARSAEDRWSGMRFEGEVLFHPQAGTVDCDRAVSGALAEAESTGAQILPTTAGISIALDGDSAIVTTSRGTVRARTVVLAVGAWLPDFGGLTDGRTLDLPPLRVSQQQVFHFARRPGTPEWPISIHKGALSTYSLPGGRDGGSGGARKVAEHDAAEYDTTARTRSGVIDPDGRQRIVNYVQEWLPGLLPAPFAEATCLYTSTENEDFLLDRVGPIVLCSPCSGHGAKFAPLIGELTADLVTGAGTPERRFSLAAHGR